MCFFVFVSVSNDGWILLVIRVWFPEALVSGWVMDEQIGRGMVDYDRWMDG